MYNSNNVAECIKKLSKSKNISVKQLLKDIELAPGTMVNMKTSMPQSDNLAKIADYLDCSVDYLLGRSDDPQSHKARTSNSVKGNYNAVDNSSVTVNSSLLNEHQKALLDLYDKLNPIQQAQLLVEADKMVKK